MCLSPIKRLNPQFIDIGVRTANSKDYNTSSYAALRILGADPHSIYRLQNLIDDGATQIKNVSQQFMYVPCGHCAECVQRKQNEVVQRAYFQSLGKLNFFLTLTYDDAHLPKYTDPWGRVFTYASHNDFRYLVRLLRKNYFVPNGITFKYFVCSERGKKRHRPHFHAVFMVDPCAVDLDTGEQMILDPYEVEKELREMILKYWAINRGTRSRPDWESRFTYVTDARGHSNFDFHYVESFKGSGKACKDRTSVAYYVSKYVTKTDPYENRLAKRFFAPWYSSANRELIDKSKRYWRVISSRGHWSRGFGYTPYSHQVYNRAIDEFYENTDPDVLVPNFWIHKSVAEPRHFSCCAYLLDKTLGHDAYKFGNFINSKTKRTDFDSSYDPEDVPSGVLMRRKQLSDRKMTNIKQSQYLPTSLTDKLVIGFDEKHVGLKPTFSNTKDMPDFAGLELKYDHSHSDEWQPFGFEDRFIPVQMSIDWSEA